MLRPGGTDAAVRGTNDDAQISKMSCVQRGYFADEFLHLFVRRGATKRAPLINRGYYARVAALKRLLHDFLVACGGRPCQIISLGAGFDTTWFHLKAAGSAPSLYLELDFPEVTRRKAEVIAAAPQLQALVGQPAPGSSAEEGRILTAEYALLPADLRDAAGVAAALTAAGLEPERPTLVLAECVLVYMPMEASQALVAQLGRLLPTAAFLVYEQILPHDAFGKQMLLNLESRGCPLVGIHGTPSLEAQRRRFTGAGWQRAWAADLNEVYDCCTDPADKRRIERLELFDEFEEWRLIQAHYCIAAGVNDSLGLLQRFRLPRFAAAPQPRAPLAG